MARRVDGVVLAAGVLALAVAMVFVLMRAPPEAPEAQHAVLVVAGDDVLFNGTVAAAATPYDLLLAAAEGRFDVESTGRGDGVFVVAIDGVRNQGTGGWCFAVDAGEGWWYPQVGAGAYVMPLGAALRWSYEGDGCP